MNLNYMPMKKTFFFSALFLLSLIGCKQEPQNPVAGAWNLIYARQVANDSVLSSFPSTYQGSQVKMWSDNYWMFVCRFFNATDTVDGFGGGSYTLDGIVYKESIVYHGTPGYTGRTLRMRIAVKNDTLVQVWPADEKGEVDKSNYTCEKYVRVK
jgi:hypothetical protein